MLLIIAYHSVGREDAWPLGGIYPVSPQRIADQMSRLGRAFEFVGQRDLLAALEGRQSLPERACLVTFDDGLAQQYDLALPVLESMGIPAVFFVCGRPLREQKVLDVHKLQWCLANIPPNEFLRTLEGYCLEHLRRPLAEMMVDTPQGTYREDEPDLRYIKYNFNYHFDPELRRSLLAAVFGSRVRDESAFAAKLYMDREAIGRLADLGYLGLHTYGHTPLAICGQQEIVSDLRLNLEVLEEAAGRHLGPLGIAYPYGGKQAVSPEAARAAAGAGVCYGLTTQRGFNFALDEPMTLLRMDTNDVPGGKAPIFSLDDLPGAPADD